MSKQLVVLSGLERGRTVRLQASDLLQFGCSQKLAIQTRFRDPDIARVHCEIQVLGDRVILSDANTTQGTFLNGVRVQTQELQSGDVIRIGSTEIRFIADDGGKASGVRRAPSSADTGTDMGATPNPSDSTLHALGDPLAKLVGKRFTHYTIDVVLGKGHWGRVFQAHDTHDQRRVALKVLRPEFANNPYNLQALTQALKLTLPVHHTNLLLHFGAGKAGPCCWIATEYIEGKSLTQIIRRLDVTGRLDLPLVYKLGIHLGRALKALHERNLTHGLLTPQNVLIRDKDGTVKLGDAMLAVTRQDLHEDQRALLGGDSLDALPYLPPEHLETGARFEQRTDIYGLGAMLHAALTGQAPFEGRSREELVEHIRDDAPIEPSRCHETIPRPLEALVLRMLSKDVDHRPADADEVLAELEPLARNLKVSL